MIHVSFLQASHFQWFALLRMIPVYLFNKLVWTGLEHLHEGFTRGPYHVPSCLHGSYHRSYAVGLGHGANTHLGKTENRVKHMGNS